MGPPESVPAAGAASPSLMLTANTGDEPFSQLTELRHLPSWARARLGQLLDDRHGHWQAVMVAIPSTPPWQPGLPLPLPGQPYNRKYTAEDVRQLENEMSSGRTLETHGSGINLLLSEWGCSGVVRPTIGDLINLLDRHKLGAASAFLRRDLLKETSTEDTTEQFQNLDLLMAQQQQQSLLAAAAAADGEANAAAAGRYEVSYSSVPELDDLLSQHSTNNQDKGQAVSTEHSQPPLQPGDEFLTLELLANEAAKSSNGGGTHGDAPPPTVEFDPSLPLVPHIRYTFLHTITDGFCDRPYLSGGRRLGKGAFGVVYKADIAVKLLINGERRGLETVATTNTRSHSLLTSEFPVEEDSSVDDTQTVQVAIKKLNFTDEGCAPRVKIKQFKMEVEILSQCSHANILPLEGYSCDGPHWCLLYAFMLHGNLQDRLACVANTAPLTHRQRINIGQGTAEGLAYLHTFSDKPLIHRDVKSANILLDANLLPKIGDFGLVRMGSSGSAKSAVVYTTTAFGTTAYMAPEAFRGEISTKMDTFSYGVVILEILSGLAPVDEGRDDQCLLSHVENTEAAADDLCDPLARPWPAGLPTALLDLASLCINDRKNNRPSMVDVVTMWRDIVQKWG